MVGTGHLGGWCPIATFAWRPAAAWNGEGSLYLLITRSLFEVSEESRSSAQETVRTAGAWVDMTETGTRSFSPRAESSSKFLPRRVLLGCPVHHAHHRSRLNMSSNTVISAT